MRNEVLSFGIDLQPEWETIVHTSSTLTAMGYIKHPLEIQVSIAVSNAFSFSYVIFSLILLPTRPLRGSQSL